MMARIFYFFVFMQLGILQAALAQTVNQSLIPKNESTPTAFVEIQSRLLAAKDSSSTKMSVVPIIAFGVGGFILGGIIGAQIDQGGPLEITEAEWKTMIIGAAAGVTVGCILAKEKKK